MDNRVPDVGEVLTIFKSIPYDLRKFMDDIIWDYFILHNDVDETKYYISGRSSRDDNLVGYIQSTVPPFDFTKNVVVPLHEILKVVRNPTHLKDRIASKKAASANKDREVRAAEIKQLTELLGKYPEYRARRGTEFDG